MALLQPSGALRQIVYCYTHVSTLRPLNPSENPPTRTMADVLQKKLQSEVEKYKVMQKGKLSNNFFFDYTKLDIQETNINTKVANQHLHF